MEKLTSSLVFVCSNVDARFFLFSGFEVRLGISQVKFCCLGKFVIWINKVGFYLHTFRATRSKRSAWTNFVGGK